MTHTETEVGDCRNTWGLPSELLLAVELAVHGIHQNDPFGHVLVQELASERDERQAVPNHADELHQEQNDHGEPVRGPNESHNNGEHERTHPSATAHTALAREHAFLKAFLAHDKDEATEGGNVAQRVEECVKAHVVHIREQYHRSAELVAA